MYYEKLQKVILPVIIVIFISMINQSCILYNATREQEKNTCSLHNIKMRKSIVKTRYGLNDFGNDPRFPNAKASKPMGCVVPAWPAGRFALVYYCTQCDERKRQLNAGKKASTSNQQRIL